jgi:cyclophilin family peptidyl-prolyl cis-trans isomerase
MSSGRRQRQQAMRQRVAAAQADQRRAARRQRVLLVGGAVVAVTVLIGFVVLIIVHATSGDSGTTTSTVRPTTASDFGKTPCPAGDAHKVTFTSAPARCTDPTGHYVAKFVTTAGDFTVTLDAARAPVTVNNFVVLAEYHYYDGTIFHRVIPGYVVQGGDATGSPPGTGHPGYTIADEFPKSRSDFTAGSVAMANTGAAHSGASQFFIWVGPHALPSPNYALFGQVSSGMATVTKIAQAGSPVGAPSVPVTIESVTIGQVGITSR